MSVRFRDLSVTDASRRQRLLRAMERVLDHGILIEGPETDAFETAFANLCGTRHAVGVASGTSALYLALKACGVGRGDEVVTTALSWVATANSINATGATPVFADIGEDLNIDVATIEACITDRTKAIVPVHFNGLMCDMDAIMSLADRRGLIVVEDAAQAAGASLGGHPAGSFGLANAFSLNPMKPLAGMGEAGAVTTQSAEIDDKLRSLRYLGTINRETCVDPELNHKMDALQAAFLCVAMEDLDAVIQRRREIAVAYTRQLGAVVECPRVPQDQSHIFFDYTICSPEREALRRHLDSRGIETKIKHPILMPDQPCYAHLPSGDLPTAKRKVDQIMCLPVHDRMTGEDVEAVCAAVLEFHGGAGHIPGRAQETKKG